MRSYRFVLALVLVPALALGVAACGASDNSGSGGSGSGRAARLSGSLNGAGATFPQPVYQEWAANFKDRFGTTVNYQGIGSGGGIAQFTAGTVDFGATDSAMTNAEQSAAKKGRPLHIPTVLGAVTVSYNVQGLAKGLRLDGPTIADIFLGKLKSWNAPQIAALNPGMRLPAAQITVCHRSEESGTTKNFTAFLADYSKAWADGPGSDKSVAWPTGTGAKGNDGVAACIKQNQGAIGYVEQAYALANNFTVAAVKNKAGNFVAPSLDATAAAGLGAKPPADLRFATIDAPGTGTYPISAVTFLLAYRDPCKAGEDAAKAKALKTWLDYALGPGQAVAKQLQYAPLPTPLKTKAQAKVNSLRCNGKPINAAT